ncbi:hypothetical protein BC833DRAFT_619793 [Globomyces pollinis-pini]|nr:hypothetical protein BC833DRAFT_619793 [Globomyces pollinis-pini]KAJ2998972.1 hypothetical protein HDV02_003810 [Globomyces sp. JEL0801]
MSSGKYVVLFKANTPATIIEDAIKRVVEQGGTIGHRYESSVLGFSATLPDDHIQTLQSHEHVEVIEGDGVVTTFAKSLGIN